MPIRMTCPHCGVGCLLPDNARGKRGRCMACQQIFTIGEASGPRAPKQPAAAPPRGPALPVATLHVDDAEGGPLRHGRGLLIAGVAVGLLLFAAVGVAAAWLIWNSQNPGEAPPAEQTARKDGQPSKQPAVPPPGPAERPRPPEPPPTPAPPPPEGAWKEFTSAEGHFRVVMPGAPEVRQQPMPVPFGPPVTDTVVELRLGPDRYAVNFADFPEPPGPKPPVEVRTDGMRHWALQRARGGRVAGEKAVTLGEHSGRQFDVELRGGGFHLERYYAIDRGTHARLYLLTVAGPGVARDSEAAARFFASFRLADGPLPALPALPFPGRPPRLPGRPPLDPPRPPTEPPAAGPRPAKVIGPLGKMEFTALLFHPDGKSVISVGRGRLPLVQWDLDTGKEKRRMGTLNMTAEAVALNPDGTRLASSDQEGRLFVWKLDEASGYDVFRGSNRKVTALAFSPGGGVLVAGGEEGKLYVFDPRAQKETMSVGPQPGPVAALAFSPDGRSVVSGGRGSIVVRDAGGWEVRATLRAAGDVRSVAFSPRGDLLAAVHGQAVTVWDASTWKERVGPLPYAWRVGGVSFAPDGKTLAVVTGLDLKLLSTDGGAERATVEAHKGGAAGVAFSPDGRTVATAGADNTIKLWEVADLTGPAAQSGAAPREVQGGGRSTR